MYRKIITLLLCAAVLLLSGCSDEKRIDKASIIETVAVSTHNGKTDYTFYVLESSDAPKGIAIEANSFKQAYLLAKEKYIPDISLSKLELIAVDEDVNYSALKADIKFISAQYTISPRTYIALCDEQTLEEFSQEKDFSQTVEKRVEGLKQKNKLVKTDALGVYNCIENEGKAELYLPLVNSYEELNVSSVKIF